ncbi:MAG TPA: phytanoyl-CoA dioxygenase family protein [Ilumatobacteraceae bacterium]|jgi:ectoine hydroxylase-related dioxygenase (phytanoyl-CoA dioxygenase family)
MDTTALTHLTPAAPLTDVLATLDRDGAVVVDGILQPDTLQQFRADMETAAASFRGGTRSGSAMVQKFWGDVTKRFTRLASRSAAFADILLNPILLGVADELLLPNCSNYWMNTGQMMIIGPGEDKQVLHRDADNWRTMNRPDGFEVTVSCMFAITDFTAEVGATRVVPGSNRWTDYTRRAQPSEITQAVMSAGSGMIYTGRALHGAGANVTADQSRFGLHVSYVLGWLTPEEASPLGADWSVVGALPERAQQLLGWRCYAAGGVDSTRLWTVDYEDVPVGLGLD